MEPFPKFDFAQCRNRFSVYIKPECCIELVFEILR
jgi:hypothetical protein